MRKLNTRLYLVTDSSGVSEDIFLKKVENAIFGGVTLLQLREKEKSTKDYIALARKTHEITQKYNIPLIIDDRVDVCLASGADGVHLGNEDMCVADARRILGDKYIIGATAKTVQSATEAWQQGANYLGTGAIFPTKTKVKTVLTPIETLAQICLGVPIPVNAIGGLNAENLEVLKPAQISGICVVSAIMKADDTKKAGEELSIAIKEKLGL